MRSAASLLSVLLHPVWMPTLALVLLFHLDPHLGFFLPPLLHLFIYAMVFAMTALFPLTSTWLLVRSGVVASMAMPERRDRVLPFLLTLFYYGMAYYLLRRSPVHPATWSLALGMLLALLLTVLITVRWKISAHMVGIGGVVGAFLALMWLHGMHAPLALCALLVAAGALGSARLLVGDHSPAQVYAGALLGLTCTFACIVTGLYF